MQRHEIPTHLDVADRAFYGLTVRQLLALAAGLALAYSAASNLPLPVAPRLIIAAVVTVLTLVLTVWRPAGRPAEEWLFVLVRYASLPRVAVWRPRVVADTGPELREVVLPAMRGPSGEEDADAA